jgi:hypothetical protein
MTRAQKCLADAVTAGKITKPMADKAAARVQQLLDKGVSEAEAMTRAAQEIAKAAAEKQHRTALTVLAADRTFNQAQSHPRGQLAGTAALFARDAYGVAGYSSVEGRARAIAAEAHGRLAQLLDAYRSKNLGFSRDLPGLRRLIAAVYDPARADPAEGGFARAWTETTDRMADRFNAAGGNLPRRADWNVPQAFDNATVKAAGEGEFTRFMQDELASGGLELRDFDTGAPLPPAGAGRIIKEAFERIASNGVSDLVPGQPGGVALANARAQPRVFHWTSADSYLRFNEKFGVGDAGLYDLLVGHIQGMAKDIAMLEILGPNPMRQAQVLIDQARKAGAGDTGLHVLENLWNQVSGASNVPASEFWAGLGRGIRNWLSSAQLGSAALSSVTDFGTIRQTAAWNGLPATAVMQRYLTLLNPANAEDRKTAVRLGLFADGWTQRALGAQRHQAEIVGNDLPGRVADVVMRASGMTAHTQAAKWAFGMELSAHLADQAGKTLDQLAPETRRSFARYGISAADWDIIRTHGVYEQEGVRFILPEQIANGPPAPAAGAPAGAADQASFNRATSRLLEMINTETGFAVVEPGALERSLLLGSSRPGTLGGEFRRATMQYKSFPVSMLSRHVMRGLDGIRGGDHGAYLAATAVSLTVMGAFAMQLKAIAQGKDPRDMTSPNFWGAAFMQGGGAGILGDFLYSAVNRADRSFYMTAIGGPTAGLLDDVMKLTGANIQALSENKDTHFGAELARFVQRNTPGTSLWYSRLAMDRLLWDRVQELADPQAPRRWRRLEQRALDDFDQRFFWAPGETAPARAPSLPAAIGARPQ